MKTFQLAWLATRFAFLEQDGGMQFGASVKQIVLLLYYTSITQTGWNIEQSEDVNQHRKKKSQDHQRHRHCSHMHTHTYIIYIYKRVY